VLEHAPPVVCRGCGQGHFNNPKPAAEVVLERAGTVLLVRRAQDPWRGHWDIPGGFCEPGEHPIRTAERELLEETGVRAHVVALIGMWIDDRHWIVRRQPRVTHAE
jgi:8-oxo-dGTP diphosphatase